MENYTSTYLIDDIKIIIGKSEFTKSVDWDDYIRENKGSFASDSQCMTFNSNGFEVVVGFDLVVDANYIYDSGDCFTPPSSHLDVTGVDVTITDITIDEYEVELTPNVIKSFRKIVEKNL